MTRERRGFSRIPHTFDAQYRVSGDLTSFWHPMTVLNVSAGGLRFRSEESLESGTVLEVRFQLPGDSQALLLVGRVVWNQLEASGVTESGIEFSDVTMDQQMKIDALVQFLKRRA